MAAGDAAIVPPGFKLDPPPPSALPPGFKLDTPAQPSIAPTEVTPPEAIAGNPATRFALGAAAPILGAAQLAARVSPADAIQQAVGLPKTSEAVDQTLKQLEEMKQKGRKEAGSEGFDFWEAAGQVLSPAFLKYAKSIPGGETYVQKILAGIGMGGLAGATTPVTQEGDFAKQKALQTGAGALVGGAIPAVTPLVTAPAKALYHGLIEPVTAPAAIKGRTYLGAAGDKVDEIIAALRGNQELVPGSAPTAGEAAAPAGSAEFSALQKQASQVNPTPYVARTDAQNAARIAALRTVGQDEGNLQAAQFARNTASKPLYEAARSGTTPVDTAPIVAKVNLILGKNPGNRELVNELTNVRRGLEEAGSDPAKVASVVDGLKATLANKDNAFIKGTLSSIKNDLTEAIPGYAQAQAKFAQMSAPVNQMQIGQYLEKKLVPALSDEAKQKAGSFATAVADAPGTIKRSTGAPRFEKLEQALTPQQMGVVKSIQDDLARGARLEDLAGKGAQAAPDISVGMGNQKLPNLLNRHVMLANAVISRLEGRVNKKIAAEIATEMLNPPAVAESLAQAKAAAAKNKAIVNAMLPYLRGAQVGAAQGAAREAQ